MILRKHTFFLLLFVITFAPFLIYKLVWIAHSERTMGVMGFVGKSYTGQIQHYYSVISFQANNDTIWFNGNDNIFFKEGELVPVRYQKHQPSEARVDIFPSMWGDTLVYGGIPVLILLVLYLHPHIFPRNTRFRFSSRKPFIHLIQKGPTALEG
jgi:hypothetical protein